MRPDIRFRPDIRRYGSGVSNPEHQDRLYNQGRTTDGNIVTVPFSAKPNRVQGRKLVTQRTEAVAEPWLDGRVQAALRACGAPESESASRQQASVRPARQ